MSSNENDLLVTRINEKIEQRLNGLQIFRLSLMNINKTEDLKNERNQILKYFFELEEELRQVNLTIKTLSSDKNKLLEHIRSNDLFIKRSELKHINQDKDIEELNNQIQDLININRLLNEKSFKAEIEIKQLRESLKLYEEQLSKKQLELENLEISNKMNSYNLGYHITNEKNTLFMQTQGNNSQINSRNDKETLNNVLNDFLNSQKFNRTLDRKLDRLKHKEDINKDSDLIQRSSSKGLSVDVSSKKESKIGKLVTLLVKIKNSNDLKKYCSDKLDKDFMQKLLSEKVSENFLEKVECVINEYVKLNKIGENDKNKSVSIIRKGNGSSVSNIKAERSTNRSSNFKFSNSELDEVKSIRSLKSSLSFSKLKNESFKNKDSYTQGRNKSSKSNKVYDFRETTSWTSLKDYFNFQQ